MTVNETSSSVRWARSAGCWAARRPGTGIVLRPPQPGDLGWVVERHGARYAAGIRLQLNNRGAGAPGRRSRRARGHPTRDGLDRRTGWGSSRLRVLHRRRRRRHRTAAVAARRAVGARGGYRDPAGGRVPALRPAIRLSANHVVDQRCTRAPAGSTSGPVSGATVASRTTASGTISSASTGHETCSSNWYRPRSRGRRNAKHPLDVGLHGLQLATPITPAVRAVGREVEHPVAASRLGCKPLGTPCWCGWSGPPGTAPESGRCPARLQIVGLPLPQYTQMRVSLATRRADLQHRIVALPGRVACGPHMSVALKPPASPIEMPSGSAGPCGRIQEA